MHVISRTREQTTAAEPQPAPDTAPSDPIDTGLDELYRRHTPDVARAGDPGPVLRAAARAHRELAGHRAAGQELIRLRGGETEGSGGILEIVTDDMPYLVESVLAAVRRAGGEARRVIHPIVVVERAADGELRAVLPDADPVAPPPGAIAESWIHVDLGRRVPAGLEADVAEVLHDVREVVRDAPVMARQARALADRLLADGLLDADRSAGSSSVTRADDLANLLRWLADGHFTFLGHRHLVADGDRLVPEGPGLGVLRRESVVAEALGPEATDAPPELLVFTRASAKSRVLRPVQPYYLAVRIVDVAGRLLGEHRFLGMLTVAALYENVLDIPVVERHVRDAIHRAGFPLASYSGQQMLEVISALPREELFSSTEQQLHDTAVGVLAVAGRRTVRVFLRPDPYRRFVSCLVYVPRDRYTTSSRIAMAEVLRRHLHGSSVDFTVRLTESALALVHFTVHTDPSASPEAVDGDDLQDELVEAIRTWDDRLLSLPGSGEVADLMPGVPEAYKAGVDPAQALVDLRYVAALSGPGDFGLRLYAPSGGQEQRFTLYLAGASATLTAVLPVLQQLGVDVLDERPSEIVRPDGLRCWTYDFGLSLDVATQTALADRPHSEVAAHFTAAFAAAWRGEAESDGFSALVLRTGLSWREVAVLRAYARYARQLGNPYGVKYMADTLLAHPAVVRALLGLFTARFDPALQGRPGAEDDALAVAQELIDAVTGLDADRILRGFLGMIGATLRTNFYRGRPFLSFKIDPSAVPDMPAPRPRFEIFVYSPRVEGVHLRYGPVARGGLRWSDRPQDFRTEILGLVKAQAVKNAVIVPVGAKGGFVVRRPEAGGDEVVACYRTFISGLLDVTDNLVTRPDGRAQTVPPPDVVRHDGDDSYLVVAADKGTAKFSDIANEVAASYGFWLGDGFASGGSKGYDHKAMGITARGAWESVKRHFRELGVDTQAQEFTVVGVGDMSGDVFGNGMLLSPHIRLLAAFDHRHVFVDPAPDAARGFAERARLFGLPRSSWDDYDRDAISAGGGVWPRTAKSVPVGAEIRAALGIDDGVDGGVTRLSPPELIRAILRAPADLLWNGGIGTYVKASEETHADAGDKANDAIRADASELRVKVVGEGGNLGLTQRGRIEFARNGGKINTDAIDNSAGVDCSDHEVNIKILLDRLVVEGVLDQDARDAVLVEMTDEVSALVLADNRAQNAVLGLSRGDAVHDLDIHARMVADLVARRALDPAIEGLPDAAGFAARGAAGEGLSGPELAVVLAHAKLDAKSAVLETDLPDLSDVENRLTSYFPPALTDRHLSQLAQHPLRREIVATSLVNQMIDRSGLTYAFVLREATGATPADALRAFLIVSAVFDLPDLWARIDELPGAVPVESIDDVVRETHRFVVRAAQWLLTRRPRPLSLSAEVQQFAPLVRAMRLRLPELLAAREAEAVRRQVEGLAERGVPMPLALHTAGLLPGIGLFDAIEVAERVPGVPLEDIVRMYFTLKDRVR